MNQTDQPTTDRRQDASEYVVAMLESFEKDHPGVAELLALHQEAVRCHSQAKMPRTRKIVSYSGDGNQ